MASSRSWGNALIIACTVVCCYAALLLMLVYGHRAHERHMEAVHHHPPHRHHDDAVGTEHFAWLALATGITGIFSACTLRKGYMYIFPVLLLGTELFVLAHISRGAVRAVHHCSLAAQRVDERVMLDGAQVGDTLVLRERVSFSHPFVDIGARDACVQGVRHAVVLSCLIVGIVCSSLMCCGSKLAAAKAREDAEAHVSPGTVVAGSDDGEDENSEKQALVKADPLAADDDEELVSGKVTAV